LVDFLSNHAIITMGVVRPGRLGFTKKWCKLKEPQKNGVN